MITGRKPKLTPEQVAEIRRRLRLWSDNTPKKLAGEYGISKGILGTIRAGRYHPAQWDDDDGR